MQEPQETYAFNIDRGGTFTDFYVQNINNKKVNKESAFKVLSQGQEGQGPVVGIRKYLKNKGLMKENQKIPNKYIEHINLGTTITTNALLERKGCKNAMLLTEGFQDLLTIRHQARPNIFDLKNARPAPLANYSIEVKERSYIKKNEKQENLQEKKIGNSTIYICEPSEQQLKEISDTLKKNKIQSVGISFCNSYLAPDNELKVKEFLEKQGFENIELGSSYHELGYLLRSQTANLDTFLNPIMKKYFRQFLSNFQQPDKLIFRIMRSDGGFEQVERARASQLLLSGPAGGLIGYQSIINIFEDVSGSQINNLIGLDMGGTSTDVSRIEDKQFATRYRFDIQGIELCTPHLEIDTIAAGGGSKLTFYNGMFKVGPQSVGSNPGPVCYGIGDELALTDANLILGRLDETYFPKIFGKSRNEGLNIQASKQAFEKLAKSINKGENGKSIESIAEGYVQIANELMAKSARKLLTMGLPDALVIFGSAGGQHCCDLAQKIGVEKVFIHKYSGILSAYGLSMAKETIQNKQFLGIKVNKKEFNLAEFETKIEQFKTKDNQKYSLVKYEVGLGYQGTSYTIKVPFSKDMLSVFQKIHKKQNGFSLSTPIIRIEYFVEHLIKEPTKFTRQNQEHAKQDIENFKLKNKEVYLDGRFMNIPVYNSEDMKNCEVKGPALLLSSTSSVLVKEFWIAKITHEITYIYRAEEHQRKISEIKIDKPDPIKLTLYSTRLMSIAEQMGKMLQKVSISTNIRERLDFSCGIFDWEGKLLANAPHLPVHLGSMQTAVSQQIKRGIEVGDVILTNHPMAGGSHLPDLTVITCAEVFNTRMYLASRGHHADIGGITPGSMPAFSKCLQEQGVAVQKFKLIQNDQFQQQKLRSLFEQSRRIQDNVSDILAQVSANSLGVKLIKKLIEEYGINEFKQYVDFICQNAAESVREILCEFSVKNNMKQVDTLTNRQFMDDGTPIELKLTIDRIKKTAVFDFNGTGKQVLANTNTPKSITKSAILYSLRSLIGQDMPLNSGVLIPIEIIIPDNTILSPSKNAAVVGGNVETSQKLVDLILKPFNHVACSQGTMNNFLFGTEKTAYYETICGGTGAGDGWNGTTVQCHMTNTRITDVESLQKTYPVILRKFKERKGSGGKGKFNGGNGVIREFMFVENVTVSLLTQRRVFGAYGVKGGQKGLVGMNTYITNQGVEKNVGGKNTFDLRAGEIIRIQTPGGGGYGKVEE